MQTGGSGAVASAFQLALPNSPNIPFRSVSTGNVGKYSEYGFQAVDKVSDLKDVSGLYIFPDKLNGMLPYIGKSNVSIASRITAHASDFRIGGQIYFKPMTGSTIYLETQETLMMFTLGGKSGTANIRFPVSLSRNLKYDLQIPIEFYK